MPDIEVLDFADAHEWDRWLAEHGEDYAELDARCSQLTTSQVEIC